MMIHEKPVFNESSKVIRMKVAFIFIILAVTSIYSWGQNFAGDDNLNCRFQTLPLVASEADCDSMLLKHVRLDRNPSSPLMFQWDQQRNKNRNLRFKITCSDSWLTRDKAHHFLSSAFLSTAGYYFFREEQKFSNQKSLAGGFCISLSLGLAKELRDGLKKNNAFSVKDLVANLFGIAVGLLIIAD